jgi:hypothetical protein
MSLSYLNFNSRQTVDCDRIGSPLLSADSLLLADDSAQARQATPGT